MVCSGRKSPLQMAQSSSEKRRKQKLPKNKKRVGLWNRHKSKLYHYEDQGLGTGWGVLQSEPRPLEAVKKPGSAGGTACAAKATPAFAAVGQGGAPSLPVDQRVFYIFFLNGWITGEYSAG